MNKASRIPPLQSLFNFNSLGLRKKVSVSGKIGSLESRIINTAEMILLLSNLQTSTKEIKSDCLQVYTLLRKNKLLLI